METWKLTEYDHKHVSVKSPNTEGIIICKGNKNKILID